MVFQQKATQKKIVWMLLFLPLVAVGVAAALLLGWAHQGSENAAANDATTDFRMSGPGCTSVDGGVKGTTFCSVPVNGSFAAVVDMAAVGSLTGSITNWQAFVTWSPGLTGPNDPSSTKIVRVNGCSELGGIAGTPGPITAPHLPLHTSAAGCAAFDPPTLPDSALLDGTLTATFELNCGATPSQETVTMIIDAGAKGERTSVSDGTTDTADLTGSETLTVLCVPPDEQINIHVSTFGTGVKQEGTCWRISYGATKIAHDVVGDNVGGVKPDCGEPSNLKLSDKDPALGSLSVTISGKQRLQFGEIWHVQNSFSLVGTTDPNNYECDLALGTCTVPKISIVGGLSVDLDGGGSGAPLEAADEGRPSAGLLAGIAAAAAAGVVALGGAPWYERRRARE